MNVSTASFFGHRQIDNVFVIEQRLQEIIQELLIFKEYVELLIGRDGEFDQLVASTVRRYKRTVRDDNIALVLVLPYTTPEYRNNELSFHEYYDEVEICTEATEHHFKSAHQVRNRFMVDRSDLVVFAWNTTQAVLIKQCGMQRKQILILLTQTSHTIWCAEP